MERQKENKNKGNEPKERICKDKENMGEKEGRKEIRQAERKEGEIKKKHKNLMCNCTNEIV